MVRLPIQELIARFPRERKINIDLKIGKPVPRAFPPRQERGVNASMFKLTMTIRKGGRYRGDRCGGDEFPLAIVGKEKTKRYPAGFQLPRGRLGNMYRIWMDTVRRPGEVSAPIAKRRPGVFSVQPIQLILDTHTACRSAQVRAVARHPRR
jgi:hypothetical protein